MKNLILIVCVLFSTAAIAGVNGDPVAKLISNLEQHITLTPEQKTEINTLAQANLTSLNKSTTKTNGQKGSRKATAKENRKEFKKLVFTNVLTAAQKDILKEKNGIAGKRKKPRKG